MIPDVQAWGEGGSWKAKLELKVQLSLGWYTTTISLVSKKARQEHHEMPWAF